MPVTQAVILCGGKGTRLGERSRDLPKPMVPVGGVPVLDHIMRCLAQGGVRRFVLSAGHLGRVIADAYSQSPVPGCTVETVVETTPRGTAGALHDLRDILDERFVVAYGDVFMDFDAGALIAAHESHRPACTLLVRASDHPEDSHLVVADEGGRVDEFVHRREPGRRYRNVANAGVYVLDRRVLGFIPPDRPSDFGADIFPALLGRGELVRTHALEAEGYVKDMGTPARLAQVEEFIVDRTAAEEARRNPRTLTTVFLDRDGVLNREVGLIARPEDLTPAAGAGEAVALLNRLGLRCVVVTNQPVIARGLCDEETLKRIHERLREMLAADGGTLAAIYHCPHHPETHHDEGGKVELRRACRCRKPSPGMIFQASRELGLDLAGAVIVGDRASDIRAGRAAGIRTVLVGDEAGRARERADCKPDAEYDSLLAFARALSEREVFSR